MPSQPEVQIALPPAVHPGQDLRIELVFDAAAETPVEGATLTFRCVTHDEAVENSALELVDESVHILRTGKLPRGRTRHEAEFQVPANAPATYTGTVLSCRYVVSLFVAIPWWFDMRESWEVVVTPEPTSRPPRRPVRAASPMGGAFIEIALDDQSFAPGDLVRGAVAIGNVAGKLVEGVDLALVSVEHGGGILHEAGRIGITKMLQTRDEGRPLPFELAIPKDAPTSFDEVFGSLRWKFEAQLGFADLSSVELTVPVTLGRFERDPGATPTPREDARAAVGASRWREVWARLAEKFELELDPRSLRLAGDLDGCRAVVGTAGGATTARLTWPAWGLGLEIEPRRLLRPSIDIGDPAFHERFDVRARDEGQARAVLVPALARALERFESVSLGDDEATLQSSRAAFDETALESFLRDLSELARLLTLAGDDLPAPTAMAEMLPAWRAFAASCDAELEAGRMRVADAFYEGGSFTIATHFAGAAPTSTEVTIRIDPPLPASPGGDSAEVVELRKGLTALVRGLGGADGVEIAGDHARFELPGPLADPAPLRPVLSAVLALVQRLRGDPVKGPYR